MVLSHMKLLALLSATVVSLSSAFAPNFPSQAPQHTAVPASGCATRRKLRLSPSRPQRSLRVSCTAPAVEEQNIVPVFGAEQTSTWHWRGQMIRVGSAGDAKSNAPAIVMVHGFGSSADTWRKQYKHLSERGFRVFGVDLLGFGLSDKPAGTTYSIGLWAELVKDFVAEFAGPEGAYVMGNSIGSLVCCTVARDSPASVRGLILCNCAAGMNNKFITTDKRTPPAGKLVFGAIFGLLDILLSVDAFANFFFDKVKSPETVTKVLQGVYVDKASVDADLVKSILDPAEHPNACEAFVKILTGDPGTTPDKFMHEIKQPMLLIWGDEDPFTPIDAGYGIYFTQELVGTRANTELKVVNAGHCPQDDGAAGLDVSSAVSSWLAERT